MAWTLFALLAGIAYAAPLAMIVLTSLAHQWNGILPDALTFHHYGEIFANASADQLWASVVTALVASVLALGLGTWAALASRIVAPAPRRVLDLLFFIPSAVPSVSVGLGLLVAFSQPPVLLNGTRAIVFIAHLVLVSAFAYGNVSAGLARLPPEFEQMAASLGGCPSYVLRRVTLPLLAPYLIAALSLGVALSMGELGATIMVYPPGWMTLPVGIFALTDRGDVFQASALTVSLILVTLFGLMALTLIPARASARR